MTGPNRALMAVFLGLGLITGNVSAAENQQRQRISLAISGGASKGSYEAGLNWAVLKMMRETEKLKTLSGGEPRPVEVASVAGASASPRLHWRPTGTGGGTEFDFQFFGPAVVGYATFSALVFRQSTNYKGILAHG